MTNKTTKKFSPEEGARAVASGALARHNMTFSLFFHPS